MSSVWLDALEFAHQGGWSPETQFAHEMGQGYLMAINMPGEPVDDAYTTIHIDHDGKYRIWVRTKNWLQNAAPGRFRMLIDQDRLPHELGASPCHGWYWEIAGDIDLKAGDHELRAQDTTGWFGRFASVIITDDMDLTPSPEKEKIWIQRAAMRGESLKPLDMERFDIIVAGAGPAGIPAAIAAARKGKKVALISSRPAVGGNSADEAGVGFDGAASNHPGMRETGIADEIRRTKDYNGLTWQGAEEALIANEKNLTIFSNQFVIDAEAENGVIRSVTTLDCITTVRRVFKADYFIDCTGDGWLGYYSGACYRLGREPKWMYNEEFAPETADNFTMSGCLMGKIGPRSVVCYYAEDVGHYVPFTAPDWAVKLPQGDLLFRNPGRLTSGEWWVENPTDMDDLWEQEYIRDELIRLTLGYFHWIKNSYAQRDLAANLKLVAFPRYNAKRETRRIIGDYVLTQNDVTKVTEFDDAIGYCGWTLDVHHPRGLYSGIEGPYYSDAKVPITAIPYRCIYSKNISNLFMAGRCASVSHLALGTVRIENTLATLGQAAGTAASLCIDKNIDPRTLGKEHIAELQQTLLRDDQSIPWVRNTDENDLARTAVVTADSYSKSERYNRELGIETDWAELSTERATMVFKRHQDQGNEIEPDFFRVQVRNSTSSDQTVPCTYFKGSFDKPESIEEGSVVIPAGYEGWIDLPLTPRRDILPWGIRLGVCEGVFWRQFDYTSFCRQRAYRLNRYHWQKDGSNAYCLRFSAKELPLADCRPENVINGLNRPLSPEDYAWVSDPLCSLPQSLTLTLQKPAAVSEIVVTVDTDSKHPSFSYLTLPVVKQTLKAFDVQLKINGEWTTVSEVRDNYLRHVRIPVKTTECEAVRIVALETHGDPSARIFEVRIY